MRVRLHRAATAEARQARRSYEAQNPDAAAAFMRELDSAIERIARFPKTWPRFEAGTRRYLLKRFPYHLIYRELATTIEVVAVMHEKRRPGYWRKR